MAQSICNKLEDMFHDILCAIDLCRNTTSRKSSHVCPQGTKTSLHALIQLVSKTPVARDLFGPYGVLFGLCGQQQQQSVAPPPPPPPTCAKNIEHGQRNMHSFEMLDHQFLRHQTEGTPTSPRKLGQVGVLKPTSQYWILRHAYT
jgi:hypothetical protein